MSFQSILSFYRPTPPPRVTCADLATFVDRFAALDLSKPQGLFGYHVKLGRAIDQDDRPTSWCEPTEPGGFIGVWRNIEYDAEDIRLTDLAGVAAGLRGASGTVYRATLFLGDPDPAIRARMSCPPEDDEDEGLDFCDTWCVEVEPILAQDLTSDEPVMVGWMAVSLNGRGYLRAWTHAELVARAEAFEPLQNLMQLCRATWPVEPEAPPRRVVKARKAMGELWPYERADRAWDWYWGLTQAG